MVSSEFRRLWGWPLLLGLLTASGLFTALVSDHWGDVWSWVGLGIPVAVMAWFSWRGAPKPTPASPPTPAEDAAAAAAAPSTASLASATPGQTECSS